MPNNGLGTKSSTRRRTTTQFNTHLPVAVNQLNPQFAVAALSHERGEGLPYIWTTEG
jgi:hypothetical protein